MAAPNPFDYEAIRNCIARYSIALDTKNFALFNEVFAEDVQAQYPFGGVNGLMRSRQELGGAIETRFVSLSHATHMCKTDRQ